MVNTLLWRFTEDLWNPSLHYFEDELIGLSELLGFKCKQFGVIIKSLLRYFFFNPISSFSLSALAMAPSRESYNFCMFFALLVDFRLVLGNANGGEARRRH